ncbi:MAG: hypothetical protein HQK84_12780 [Nitrospinae bacterium]|nr:hypothetical protein [Nitrospinota bacterium]
MKAPEKTFFFLLIGVLFFFPLNSYSSQSILYPLSSSSLLLDIAGEENNFVAVGERGHVLLSNDNGNSWRQVAVPTNAMLTSVTYKNGEIWAAGHESSIIYSPDAGKTWKLQYHDSKDSTPFFDIFFLNNSHGFAIGAYGLFLKTTNKGKTWERITLGDDDFHLYSMTSSKSGALFIVGESGIIYKSVDSGNIWQKLNSPYQGSFFGILSTIQGRLYLFGQRGNLFTSEDEADSWEKVQTETKASLQGGVSLGNGNAYIVGNSGTVILTDGKNVRHIPYPITKTNSNIYQMNNKTFLIIGKKGVSKPLSLPEK